MVDRQDIDALLIGALYGELTPADEARLTAHLESHPADRGALDDLKSARQSVRESRIFELQLDPPQAVSALLLQEAARRAPRRTFAEERSEGWFARFVRSFVAHPAMAAAATLVLVVGIAGAIYMKQGGDEFAEKTVSAPAIARTAQQDQQDQQLAPAKAPDEAETTRGAGSGYNVRLADNERNNEPSDGDLGGKDRMRGQPVTGHASASSETKPDHVAPQRQVATAKKPASYMEVNTPQASPKNMAKDDDAKLEADSTVAPGGGGGFGAANGMAKGEASPPPPPPQVAQIASDKPAGPRKSAPAKPEAAPSTPTTTAAAPADTSLIAWAKSQHAQAVSLTRDGKCSDAAALAVSVSNQAPDYYNQFMATDRELKPCQQYITIAREKSADRAGAGKAAKAKAINADEAPAASKK